MSAYTPTVTGTGPRAAVQRFGAFLAGMIMPNLGAFIAWGLITALFIPTGWVNLIAGHTGTGATPLPFTVAAGSIVGPIIVFLIPILIGYTGGRQVHGQRGAVVGAIATVGVIVSPIAYNPKLTLGDLGPQFLGALIIGPLTALILKQWDRLVDGRLKAGFEMLVDNFSAGIIGGVMAMVGLFWLGPVVVWISTIFGNVVNWLISAHVLPLAQIIIEPAKVLFLNNAIGNGVLVPLAANQAHATGQSILFMLEADPGPGLGILLAMMLFGPRAVRPTVPAAIVVQFLGGIHEIYFPYVLMKPILIIAAICGGMVGTLTWVIFGVGLRGPASPGSIFAFLIECPPGEIVTMLLGVILAAGVAFIVGAVLLGFGRSERTTMSLEEANEQNARNKGRKTAVAGA